MSRGKPKAPSLGREAIERRDAVMKDVLAALAQHWGTTEARSFDDRIKQIGPTRWQGLTSRARIVRLKAWLEDAQREMRDAQRPLHHRYRRAWEISPATCVGQDIDPVIISAVIAEVDGDIRQLDRLAGQLDDRRANAATRAEINALIEGYRQPQPAAGQWACVVEAIRAGAEDLPVIVEALGSEKLRAPTGRSHVDSNELRTGADVVRSGAVDAAPFVAVVLDAMYPGSARALDPAIVRKAVNAWGRRILREGASAWDLIGQLLQPPLTPMSGDAMRRRWPSVKGGMRLDLAFLITALSQQLAARNITAMVFDPTERSTPLWVRMLGTAVRAAMPRGTIDGLVSVGAVAVTATTLPGAFVEQAMALWPPERQGRRGRPSVPLPDVLVSILDYLNTSRSWREIPHGDAAQRRLAKLQRTGHLEEFKALAIASGVLRGGAPAKRR